ncbi:MAG: hypothetical protein A2W30_00475 [Ignavibacteria bacterium RBG_16_36_9]|nr:MAG: hypothetical protein A2W30_00475 [Ignavibacteria bacterium RBG_16_36_9]
MQRNRNLIFVGIFAIAMAYLESAVVVYLRAIYGIEDLIKDINLTPDIYTFIEIGREAATLVMLSIIGLIAGNTWPKKIGYFFLSFGVWDIFYYFWLYVFILWPKSFFEWDILFLIPFPWWGPVLAPVLISILLISIGYLLISEINFKVTLLDCIAFGLSIIVLLYTFVEDSIEVIISGSGELTSVRPTSFNWILFLIAYTAWTTTSIKVFYPCGKR